MTAAVSATAVWAAAVPTSMADGSDPLARARSAADSVRLSGQVEVQWIDHAGVSHATELQVQGGDGVIRVGGGAALLAATKEERWLFRAGEWDLVSPQSLASAPPIDRKYSVATADGPDVAGRTTTIVSLRSDAGAGERLFLDRETGLVLRREQLDKNGTIVRAVWYESLELDPATSPAKPGNSADHQPSAVASVHAPYRAPSRLDGGYERTAVYRRPNAVQVVYSDGVHTLSVFEQRGRFDKGSVPEGAQPVDVGSSHGVRMTWAGGEVVMWGAGQSTFTVVGDGDADEVATAARSMPGPARLSSLQRLHRACASIVDAVSG